MEEGRGKAKSKTGKRPEKVGFDGVNAANRWSVVFRCGSSCSKEGYSARNSPCGELWNSKKVGAQNGGGYSSTKSTFLVHFQFSSLLFLAPLTSAGCFETAETFGIGRMGRGERR